jgi:hypothetical protein
LHYPKPDLLQIALAARPPRVLPGARKNRKQDGREQRDNGYNDQKFDQGKTLIPTGSPTVLRFHLCLQKKITATDYYTRNISFLNVFQATTTATK